MRGLIKSFSGRSAPTISTVTLRASICHPAGPLAVPSRLQSTSPMEQLIINGAAWESSNYYHRLGFQEAVRDSSRIKEHYHILAKHFHPDNPNAPPNATAAFQNIKEAYDHLMEEVKDEVPKSHPHTGHSYRFTDHERRQQQMRFLGEGIGLFMAMTLVFIFIVSRHNSNRVDGRYLGHFAIIFLTIQVFPRLLAAAILYACHSNYLVSIAERTEQAAVSLIVEQRESHLAIRAEGIDKRVRDRVVMQVTYPHNDEPRRHTEEGSKDNENNNKKEADTRKGNLETSPRVLTTVTFDSGVTQVIVPATRADREPAECRVKVVDEARGFVIVDRTFEI
ncbi:heat shock protein, putative [Trypanosoma brucei gambiense DAL972]|uniref:Heat shock protein, putative n=2 Tax=Trypanosoma brucei TaxID=5691 RepID=D0A2V8_TRYB9|nr:heat shock protein, putative [Trypanosoma brucei gambiense DAL972]RHW69295.1 heat shock protein [Trypanosoma brucei equiperdum]CBH15602.1 heat shock protein, putative [Trypanosoma brucei gambiense DAL972]|eukprot:XP_011777866.1 heat shock protein, putative [Trypanosoma brucei gambiense DAL972]